MTKQNFTRKEVIELVDQILQNPDELMDAVNNEDTDWDAECLIKLAEDYIDLRREIDVSNRFILDACCGSRMFWFDKSNPNCLFIDKRSEIERLKIAAKKAD